MHAVAECRHPTVALIQGACVGGGLLIASQCDLRICNESARFGVPVKNLGLTESYDELQAMMRVIGPASSLEILLEGRIWGAREAYEKGLVSRVVADDKVAEEAYAAARRIAEGAPLVARWHKKFIRRPARCAPADAGRARRRATPASIPRISKRVSRHFSPRRSPDFLADDAASCSVRGCLLADARGKRGSARLSLQAGANHGRVGGGRRHGHHFPAARSEIAGGLEPARGR